MNIIRYPKKEEWGKIVERPHLDVSKLNDMVTAVLADIKKRGDDAVKGYELKFDHVDLPTLDVSEQEMEEAERLVSAELKAAIQLAHYNIHAFHEAQQFKGKKVGGTLYPRWYRSPLLYRADARHTRQDCRL